MLERAVAVFEQCAIHRSLPLRLPLATTRRRRLKPTFWKHGAVDIEISEAWNALQQIVAGADAEQEAEGSKLRGHNVPILSPKAHFTATCYEMQYASLPSGIFPRPTARRPTAVVFKGRWKPSRFGSRAKPITSSSQSQTLDSRSPTDDPTYISTSEDVLVDGRRRTTGSEELGGSHTQHLPCPPASDGRKELGAERRTWIQPHTEGPMPSFLVPASEHVGDLNKFDPTLLEVNPDSLDKHLLLVAIHTNLAFGSYSRALECFSRCLQNMPADASQALEILVYSSFNSNSFPLLLESWRVWTRDGTAVRRQLSLESLHHLTRQSLPEVVSSFWDKLERVRNGVESNNTDDKRGTEDKNRTDYAGLNSLLLSAMQIAIFKPCRPLLATNFILRLRDATTYAAYIRHCIAHGQVQHLPSLYWVYVHRQGNTLDHTVFSLMMRHFLGHGNLAQALVVHYHYCTYYYTVATPEAKRVLPMDEWWLQFAQEAVLQDFAGNLELTHVPFVSAIHKFGDLEMVNFAEESLKTSLGIVPGNLARYKEIRRLCKSGKYREVVAESSGGKEEQADFFTLVLCLSTASRSNDLSTTLSLFNTAKSLGWHYSPLTLKPVIQVLGALNLLKEAEIMCSLFFSTRSSKNHEQFDSLVPNAMLSVYCEKGESAAAQRLFLEMKQHGIRRDRQTWHHIAEALCRVGDVSAAEALVMAKHQWQRDPVIFEILMGGALRTHQFRRVHKYTTMMDRRAIPISLNAYSMLARATIRLNRRISQPRGHRKHMQHRQLDTVLLSDCETLLKHFSRDIELRKLVLQCGPSEGGVFSRVQNINHVAATVAEAGDAATMTRFESLLLQLDQRLTMGVKISSMRFHLARGNHGTVRSLWRELLANWVAISKETEGLEDTRDPAAPPKPPPGKEHVLDVPFNLLRQVFQREKTAGELLQTLNEVVGHGFLLGKRNWNRSIQMLALGGYWKEAFLLCETVLMPNWEGWRFMRAREISERRESIKMNYQIRQHIAERKRLRRRRGVYAYGYVPDNSRQPMTSPGIGQSRSFGTYRGPLPSRHVSGPKLLRRRGARPSLRRQQRLLQSLEGTEKADRDEFEAINPMVRWYLEYSWVNRKVRRWQRLRKATGASPRLRPEVMRPTRHPHYLTPLPHTLLTLGRTFADLSKSHWWDEGASEALRAIREMCPKTVAAVQELRYHPNPRVQTLFATTVIPLGNRKYEHPWAERGMRKKIKTQVMSAYWAFRGRFNTLERLRAQRKYARRLQQLPLHRMARKIRPSLLRWVSKLKPSKLSVRISRNVLLWRRRTKLLEIAQSTEEQRRRRPVDDDQTLHRLLIQILSSSISERAQFRQRLASYSTPQDQANHAEHKLAADEVTWRRKQENREEQFSDGLAALEEASQHRVKPKLLMPVNEQLEWDIYKVPDESNAFTKELAALDEDEQDDKDENKDKEDGDEEDDEDGLGAKARKKKQKEEIYAQLAKDKAIRKERKMNQKSNSRRKQKTEPKAPTGKGSGRK